MRANSEQISFRRCNGSPDAWIECEALIKSLIESRNLKKICDIGGGANPILSMEYVRQHGLEYTVLDISEAELLKAPADYHKIVADIASKDFAPGSQTFDLVVSKMLAEHVYDARQFHSNIRKILSQNGMAAHLFPTLYAPPFVVNRIIPEALSDRLLSLFAPRDRHQHGKFPAYYQWCRGPTSRQFRRLSSVGLDVVQYVGYFGHYGYYRKLPVVRNIHTLITKLLVKFPIANLTSFAFLVVKPAANTSGK